MPKNTSFSSRTDSAPSMAVSHFSMALSIKDDELSVSSFEVEGGGVNINAELSLAGRSGVDGHDVFCNVGTDFLEANPLSPGGLSGGDLTFGGI